MKYLIWQDNDDRNNKNNGCLCKNNGKILNILLTNHSFAEIFEGDNPLHPVGGTIQINHKRYRITRFEKISDGMIEIVVVLATEGVSEAA